MRQQILIERDDLDRLKAGEVLTLTVGGQSVGLCLEGSTRKASTRKPQPDQAQEDGASAPMLDDAQRRWQRHNPGVIRRAPRVIPVHAAHRCPECGELFRTPTGLGSHRLAKHGVKGSSDTSRQYQHLKAAQTTSGPYACTYCKKHFPTRYALGGHSTGCEMRRKAKTG